MTFRFLEAAAGGIAALGLGAALAQEITGDAPALTVAGAKVMLTEIQGMDKCRETAPPPIPDGASVNKDELESAKAKFLSYMGEAEAYRTCIDTVAKQHGGNLTPEQNAAVTMVYDDNVEQLQRLAQKFNEQINAWKDANGD